MITLRKKIIYVLIIVFVFFFGLLVGVRHSFPYPQLKYIKTYFIGENRVASTLYYYEKIMYESIFLHDEPKIVMLGDSITDAGDWDQLSQRKDILNRGISGDNSDGLLSKLDSIPTSVTTAFIMIGINDLGKGSSVEYIFNNYKKIIYILKSKNINPIIQSTLYIEKDFGNRKNKDVKYLNQLLYKYCNDNNLTFVNLNSNLSTDEHLLKKYSKDGLHINSSAYNIWIKNIKNYF